MQNDKIEKLILIRNMIRDVKDLGPIYRLANLKELNICGNPLLLEKKMRLDGKYHFDKKAN